jgi:hypothetical protein
LFNFYHLFQETPREQKAEDTAACPACLSVKAHTVPSTTLRKKTPNFWATFPEHILELALERVWRALWEMEGPF